VRRRMYYANLASRWRRGVRSSVLWAKVRHRISDILKPRTHHVLNASRCKFSVSGNPCLQQLGCRPSYNLPCNAL